MKMAKGLFPIVELDLKGFHGGSFIWFTREKENHNYSDRRLCFRKRTTFISLVDNKTCSPLSPLVVAQLQYYSQIETYTEVAQLER